jgi:hypothetical protein
LEEIHQNKNKRIKNEIDELIDKTNPTNKDLAKILKQVLMEIRGVD